MTKIVMTNDDGRTVEMEGSAVVSFIINPAVEKNILPFIQYASEYTGDQGQHQTSWDQLEDLHYQRWQEASAKYAADVRSECDYRQEQLTHSFHQREAIVRAQLEAAEDEKILKMRTRQLENLISKYQTQMKQIDDTVSKVDIHTNLLIRGVLHVD